MEIVVARTPGEIDHAYKKLENAAVLGCDTETSALSARTGKIFSVQFSDGGFSALIPLSEGVSLGKFERILESEKIVKVFHNAKFDLDFLAADAVSVRNVFCTMAAEKLLTKGANQSVSLAETLYRYFAVDLDKSQRAKFNRRWDGVWTPELVNYALSDVVHLPQLMKEQNLWLERLGLESEFLLQMEKICGERLAVKH